LTKKQGTLAKQVTKTGGKSPSFSKRGSPKLSSQNPSPKNKSPKNQTPKNFPGSARNKKFKDLMKRNPLFTQKETPKPI